MAKKNNNEEEAGTVPVIQAQTNVPAKVLSTKEFFEGPAIKKRFEELLGKNAPSFITSILQVVTNDKLLAVADSYSVYNASCTAAIMGLSINPNLGQSYIIGYKNNSKGGQVFAQWQIGWKGLVQLAQRTNQYKTLHTTEVYENQFESYDYMTGEFKMKNVAPIIPPIGKVVGYVSYFKLLSGFEKTFYMTHADMLAHAKKYSKSFNAGFGTWADGENGFNAMGKKTVLKLNLDKYGPKSIEMQKAITLDQSIIKDELGTSFEYIDNSKEPEKNHEEDRIKKMIDDCVTLDELGKLLEHCATPELEGYYTERKMNIESLTA